MPFTFDVPGLGPVQPTKVLGIGKNYASHVAEMTGRLDSGAAVDRKPPKDPVLFLKPASALVANGGAIEVRDGIGEVHHEVELAAVIGARVRKVAPANAHLAVAGYAIAIDVTARELQAAAKRNGWPWDIAKGMDSFCPIGAVKDAADVPDPQDVALELKVNGEVRQSGSTAEMTRPISQLVAYASRWFTLEPGDVILTGTPAGVGPMKPGDVVEATAEGVGDLSVRVVAAD